MKGTPKNLLRGLIAALRGTHSFVYLVDMSQSLRYVRPFVLAQDRLALKPLATVFRGALKLYDVPNTCIGYSHV